MIEIGNGVFTAEESEQALAMAQTHMTYWCIMKAIMLLGNDFTKMSKETLGVVSNADAISVNQDDLGIAGRRVKSVKPGESPTCMIKTPQPLRF
jgi:alpha-galactosidase